MITKEIKALTKYENVDNTTYNVGIEAIYQAYLESKSPIDEELTFWTVCYQGFYGVESAEIAELIKKHSNENDTILDTFSGGGTTAIACKKLNRNFHGCEIDENYYKKTIDIINKI